MKEGLSVKQKLHLHEGLNPIDWGVVKETSIYMQIPGPLDGEWLSIVNNSGQTIIRIFFEIATDSRKPALTAEIRMDTHDKPLVLSVNKDIFHGNKVEAVIQYDSASIKLWINGVLIDEEWPFGSLPFNHAMIHVRKELQATIWNYALSAMELEELFAGHDPKKTREALLGREPSSVQYWKPPGHNTSVGDCMPYYDGERFHIYYLFDRRGHRSKWGLGAHQWAHISSRNLKDWEYHPMAVEITGEWEGSICTGSVIQANNRYYAYYAVRAVDRSPARLTWAESADGIHFEKTGVFIELKGEYDLPSIRDPHVFQDSDGQYRMLITTSCKDGSHMAGCLAQLVSSDLEHWHEEEPPFIVPGYHDQPECADYFEWNGWYYLIFSNDGNARYRLSRNPKGPWLRPAADRIDGIQLRVPKSAGFADGRRLVAGFLSTPDRYGGELVIRELVQHADGTLGTKFAEELLDRTGSILRPADCQLPVTIGDLNGFSEYVIGDTGESYMLSFEVTPHYANMFYGISVADSADFNTGFDIRFEPSSRKVGIHEINGISYKENEVASIYQVTGLHDRVVQVEVIMTAAFVDLCINGERTIISRLNTSHCWLRLFSHFGSATFDRIRIQALSK